MHTRSSARRFVLCAMLAAASALAVAAEGQPPQVPAAIRTGITVVPIDVRVLDRNGKPVTDLKQEDFTIEEGGIPQEIGYFSTHALTPEPVDREDRPTLRRAQDGTIAPNNRRTFLIVLGRGRLQHPARGVDALIEFVRERLLPQDQVAVLAYNRATDFTVHHEPVAKLLERFRRANDRLDVMVREHFTGLRAIYGSSDLPPGSRRISTKSSTGRKARPRAGCRAAESPTRDRSPMTRSDRGKRSSGRRMRSAPPPRSSARRSWTSVRRTGAGSPKPSTIRRSSICRSTSTSTSTRGR